MSALTIISVLVAGALGALLRWRLSVALPVRPRHLPWGILIVNSAGSLVAGAVLGLAERAAVSDDLRLVIVTGFCGGLTTFSTWTVETIELLDGRRFRAAVLNASLTLVLGLGAAALGYLCCRAL
ncbi:MAG TPA: fluoride efflux transporter CrcB [Candidatus Lumbricidophila sp.]|nr:fluoride efflux transporter CrcB [Candidatus Lumbricidophila sp.]